MWWQQCNGKHCNFSGHHSKEKDIKMVIDTIKGLKYFEVVYRLDNKICIKLRQFRPLLKWSKIAKIGSLDFTSYTFFYLLLGSFHSIFFVNFDQSRKKSAVIFWQNADSLFFRFWSIWPKNENGMNQTYVTNLYETLMIEIQNPNTSDWGCPFWKYPSKSKRS